MCPDDSRTDPADTTDNPLAGLDRERLAAIIQSSDDAIVSKTLDGTVRSWNPAAERIFGYTADEMVGQPIFRVIPEELHPEEHMLLARIRAGEHVPHYETTRVRKDGRRIRISLTLSPVWAADGRLVGASAIKRDITARRMLEQQMLQAQKLEAVGRLAGGIAHDFNNLLTVIVGASALLLARLPADGDGREDAEQIAAAAGRAASLTQQLLAFSRRQLVEPEVLEVDKVVADVVPMLRRLIGEHIEFRTVTNAAPGLVRINRGQLEQVILNLALNARDAMPDGGTLTIETQEVVLNGGFAREQLQLTPGRYVMLAVGDTGVGMDPVTQASIFEPFFTTKDVGQGTGLGLATVYGIVQQAGGALYVYSELGRGSVFKVYLPPAGAPLMAAPSKVGGALGAAAPHLTVLLAEDDPAVRAFTGRALREAGYQVIEAASGEAAAAAAAAHSGPIHLLLTDVVMPGVHGRALAERLHAERPELAVVYMSGYTDDMVIRSQVVTAGAVFLQKPFTPATLLERVQAALQATPETAPEAAPQAAPQLPRAEEGSAGA